MHHFIHWLAIATFSFFNYASPYIESAYPIDEKPMIDLDTSFYGKYYLAENPEKTDHFTIEKGYSERNYHLVFWTRGGDHPQYESDSYISKIGDAQFINIKGGDFRDKEIYLLVRLMPDKRHHFINAPVVSDERLSKMKSSAEVRAYIAKNIDNPALYKDTLHFNRGLGPYETMRNRK